MTQAAVVSLLALALGTNPPTYQVDALRTLMLVGGDSKLGMAVDCHVLAATLAVLVAIAARLYPRMTA